MQEKINRLVDSFGGNSERIIKHALEIGRNDNNNGSALSMQKRGVLSWYTAAMYIIERTEQE